MTEPEVKQEDIIEGMKVLLNDTKEYWKDLYHFAKEALPEHMTYEIPSFHKQIYSDVKSAVLEHKNVSVVMPREFGKSTIMMTTCLWALLFGFKKLIIYISKSYETAVRLTAPIKKELEGNGLLKACFGNQVSGKWSEGEFELTNGAKVVALGRGQPIRGMKHINYRPDLIILDDIEDDEEVNSQDQRMKVMEWFDKQVIKAVDSNLGTIIPVGTILHPDSLLSNITTKKDKLEKYTIFTPIVYKALVDGSSIWETKFPTPKLLEERRLDFYTFAQERMNEPVPVGTGWFKKEHFKYYHLDDKYIVRDNGTKLFLSDCNIYVTVDLAVTERTYSDYTVLMATAVSSLNEWFVIEYTRNKWSDPDKVIDEIFRLHSKYEPNMIGIEAVSFQKWLIKNMQKEMKKRNIFPHLCELKADKEKTRRISSIQPRFAQGLVYFRNTMIDLEEELVIFPKSPHDDLSDALAYVGQIAQTPERITESQIESGSFKWWKEFAHRNRLHKYTGTKHLKEIVLSNV